MTIVAAIRVDIIDTSDAKAKQEFEEKQLWEYHNIGGRPLGDFGAIADELRKLSNLPADQMPKQGLLFFRRK